jgi:Mu-like prophage major head subunit gpT
MALITTGNIINELKPGLAAIAGAFARYPSEYSDLFDIYASDKAFEVEVEMKFLGLAQVKPEGSPTALDTMGQRIITTYTHRNISIGFAITKEAIEDNLYKTYFPMQGKSLMDSMVQTKETLAASIINNGFNPLYAIGDGQPLFSTAHPIDGGTYANRPTIQADLNEASLESAIIAIQLFKNQAGLIVMTKPRKLFVSPQNQFVAERLLGSSFRTSTANNDISAMYAMGAVPEGARSMHFITIPGFWGLKTDSSDGFKHYERTSLETDVYTDFITSNLMAKAMQRYSFGVTNARAMYASSGT